MRKTSLLVLIAVLIASLAGCSVNVKKGENGEEKQVDINTIAGGIHVNKDVDSADTGLAVYPGAQLKPKTNDQDGNRANVNLSAFGFGLKVVALDYLSNDPPAKIQKFYSDQLAKYGTVLVCHTADFDMDVEMKDKANKNSNELTCGDSKGANVELKVGKKDDQHLVSIKPNGKGSEFSLVYLRTHGKDADI